MKKFLKKFLAKFPRFFLRFKYEDYLYSIQWITKISKLYCFFKNYVKIYSLPMFLETYIEDIKKYVKNENKDIFIKNLLKNFESIDDDSKMILLFILYYSKLLTDDVVERYMKYAQKTKNKKFRYWFTMDISRMTFLIQMGVYDDYYNDRKKLLSQICDDCKFEIPKKSKKNKNNKLCIVTHCLEPTVFNSVQRVAMLISKGLNKYFDEIMVITLDCFATTKNEKKETITTFSREFSIKKQREIQKMFEKNVKVYCVHIGDYKKRYQEALDYIYKYNPNIILDMSDEYSIISYYYSKDYLTFYLPLRNNVSSSFFNYFLCDENIYNALNKKYNCVEEKKVLNWTFPEYVPSTQSKYSRDNIKLNKNSFIIITIGNNDKVIDDLLADKMGKLLQEHEDFIWLLVGGDATEYMHKNFSDLFDKRKIIEWGFEKELAGLCKICDVVLRPNTTGSSGATAIAAQQGIPVVMTNFLCDPMRWLGIDYTNIDNYDKLIEEIVHLHEDKEYYRLMQKKILEKINDAINEEKSWKRLNDLMKSKREEL